jgi:hypothetical protein
MTHPRLSSAAFSPDGRFLVTVGGGSVRIWLIETGEPLSPPMFGRAAQWTSSGSRLLVDQTEGEDDESMEKRRPRKWVALDLARKGQDEERLAALARWLAGRQVDPDGGLVALDDPSLRNAWQAVNH